MVNPRLIEKLLSRAKLELKSIDCTDAWLTKMFPPDESELDALESRILLLATKAETTVLGILLKHEDKGNKTFTQHSNQHSTAIHENNNESLKVESRIISKAPTQCANYGKNIQASDLEKEILAVQKSNEIFKERLTTARDNAVQLKDGMSNMALQKLTELTALLEELKQKGFVMEKENTSIKEKIFGKGCSKDFAAKNRTIIDPGSCPNHLSRILQIIRLNQDQANNNLTRLDQQLKEYETQAFELQETLKHESLKRLRGAIGLK